MPTKSILIIGAGGAQVPLIKAARREGYRAVVCDWDRRAPGAGLADDFRCVSTKNGEELLRVARERRVDGVVANSEYAMCDVARIAACQGLVGNPVESIASLSSKAGFRALQRQAGLLAPQLVCGDDPSRLVAEAAALTFPVVVKPDQCSGSRGTTVVRDPADRVALGCAVSACIGLSRNGFAVVEEYVLMTSRATIEGEVFVNGSAVLWDGLFLTVRGRRAPHIPATYVFPLEGDGRLVAAVRDALRTALAAAGVRHGEYNVEAYVTASGEPFVIEINPRQGGNDLPRYVREHCGVDLTRLLVTTSVGDDYYWDVIAGTERSERRIVHHMLYPDRDGRFAGLRVADSLAGHLYRSELFVREGDLVHRAVDGSDAIGYVDFECDNAREQLDAAFGMDRLAHIELEEV